MRDARSDSPAVLRDLDLLVLVHDSRVLSTLKGGIGRDDSPRLMGVDRSGSTVKAIALTASDEVLAEMAERMRESYRGWKLSRWVRAMDYRYALQVRHWRVDEFGSWRYVAAKAFEAWDGKADLSWRPYYSQLVGIVLCERAAELLGEDKSAPPWN